MISKIPGKFLSQAFVDGSVNFPFKFVLRFDDFFLSKNLQIWNCNKCAFSAYYVYKWIKYGPEKKILLTITEKMNNF